MIYCTSHNRRTYLVPIIQYYNTHHWSYQYPHPPLLEYTNIHTLVPRLVNSSYSMVYVEEEEEKYMYTYCMQAQLIVVNRGS